MKVNEKWAVVTGAGSGIGRSLTLELATRGFRVLGVGRRPEPLKKLQNENPSRISVVSADVSAHQGRLAIGKALPVGHCVRLLVHNAGLLAPVAALKDVRAKDWRYHMAVNLEGPLFLTQRLLPKMAAGSRVLHLSSGAAHAPYRGWGAYCTSKAALHMLYRCMDQELEHAGIRVGSVRPGVVDTPMQDLVRSAPESVFPDLPRFVALKQEKHLTPPEKTAHFLAWLLLETEDPEFADQEWDIRDEQHHHRWGR